MALIDTINELASSIISLVNRETEKVEAKINEEFLNLSERLEAAIPPPIIYYTFTINAVPSNSIIILTCDNYVQNGNSITVASGSVVNYSVSCSGYNEVSGVYTVESDYIMDIELESSAVDEYILQPVSESITIQLAEVNSSTNLNTVTSSNYKWYWNEVRGNGYLEDIIFDTQVTGAYGTVAINYNLLSDGTTLQVFSSSINDPDGTKVVIIDGVETTVKYLNRSNTITYTVYDADGLSLVYEGTMAYYNTLEEAVTSYNNLLSPYVKI